MKVVVTGAAGFVGAATVTHLREHGHEVTALTRREWDITTGARPLTVDAVVHCAALADDWAPLGTAMLANRFGTRNVVASFPGARFVHVSTSSVYDAFSPSVRVREDAPLPSRFLSSYSESKAAAEAEVPAGAVVLRPHAVYGPGTERCCRACCRPSAGTAWCYRKGAAVAHTLTHIDNLVHAASLALTGPAGIYNIGDDTDVLLSAVLTEFLSRRGVDARLTAIPYRTAFALAGASEALARATGSRPRLTRYAVSQLGLERTLDLTAARERLGYTPGPTTLRGAEQW